MFLFYHPQAVPGASVQLDSAEAMHISKVLRKKDGDIIQLTDGKGKLYEGVLQLDKRDAWVSLGSFAEKLKSAHELEIAIAPTKNQDRMEWLVEKAVEIGIQKITLLHCEHSERTHLRPDRLQRVAIAAMKQSLKFFLPEITEPLPMQGWIKQCKAEQKMLAHCRADMQRVLLRDALKPSLSGAIAIGPEGDFSSSEIEAAQAHQFVSVSLGESRLRTETAALCAVHTFQLANQ